MGAETRLFTVNPLRARHRGSNAWPIQNHPDRDASPLTIHPHTHPPSHPHTPKNLIMVGLSMGNQGMGLLQAVGFH